VDWTAEQRLGTALKRVIERGTRSVDAVADAAGVARSTVYAWMAGDAPTIGKFAQLLEAFPIAEDQAELIAAIAGGAQVRVEPITPEIDLDLNGDGVINTDDSLEASATACEKLAELMRGLVSRRTTRADFAADECDEFVAAACRVERLVAKSRIIATRCVRRTKRCTRPLPMGGGA
jgi:predicted transcriptional regulator